MLGFSRERETSMPGEGVRSEEVLEGWKAIAEYLRLTERTVQRWEKDRGLPVRRFKGESPDEQSRVFAYKAEIDAWWKQNTSLRQQVESKVSDPSQSSDDEDASSDGKDHKQSSSDDEEKKRRRRLRPISYLVVAVVAAVIVVLALKVAPLWGDILFPPSKATLGVVPIRNLTGAGDPQPQLLAEGLTEELISGLGRLHPARLGVVGLSPSPSDNAKLDYRLEGTVL